MTPVEFLYLSQKDVIDVELTMADAISIVEEVLIEHGLKEIEMPPKPGIHTLEDSFIHAMPGYLRRKKAAGMKWVSGYSGNFDYQLPNIMGLIVLNDVNTGQPLAVMDGAYITALRTAAVSGVSAKYLANRDARTIGIAGAGVQGRYNLLSFKEVLPDVEVARVFDINEQVAQSLVSAIGEHVPFKIEICESAREVIEGADVLVTATGRLVERIYKESWVKAGALVLPVHTRGWEKAIVDKADKFIVDDWKQFDQGLGGADGYYAPLPERYAELGEIVAGNKPGRENPAERIININFGMALNDVYMASKVLEKARQKKIGTLLPLVEGAMPYN